MSNHHSIRLQLKTDKPDCVYRYIDDWEIIQSSHGENIYYLFLYGVFQWGSDRNEPIKAFSIAIQYSNKIGMNVDISQPPHIKTEDVAIVTNAFSNFIKRVSGQ